MPRLPTVGEELGRPETSGLVAQKPTLWSTAPAWRKLVVASGLLTSLAISAPMVLPGPDAIPSAASSPRAVGLPKEAEPTQQSCTSQLSGAPQPFTARVTRFVPSEQVLAVTRSVEAQEGAKISPAYLHLTRVAVEGDRPNGKFATMAAVPEYMTVKVGDLVEVNSRYRDPSLPCHFIPWTINRLVNQVK
jgi:hypothetical protein